MGRPWPDVDAVWRWFRQPWGDPGVAIPLLAALAVPALLLSAGDRFEHAVSDATAGEVVDGLTPAEQGLTLTINGRLHAEEIGPARDVSTERLRRVGELGPIERTVYTPKGRGEVLAVDGADRSGAMQETEPIPAPVRFFARAGTIDALDLIEVDPTIRGVYVSQDLATRSELSTGALLDIEVDGVGVVAEVEGIYRDLWPSADTFWDDVSPTLIPRFSDVFNTPNFELLIVREAQANDLGLPGLLQLDAPVDRSPRTLAELERLDRRLRAVERDLASDDELVDALEAFAGLSEPVPAVQSMTPEALDEVQLALRRLDQPLIASQVAGLGLGLLVVVAAATFGARREAVLLRLMVNGGQRPSTIALVGMAQYLALTVTGAVIGFALGNVTAGLLVGDGIGALSWPAMAELVPLALLGAAIIGGVRGLTARRLADRSDGGAHRIPTGAVLVLAGVSVAGWIQVGGDGGSGRGTSAGGVDPLVVGFPIVTLCAALGIVLAISRWLIQQAQTLTGYARPGVRFAIRRVGHAQAGVLGLAGALGVAVGIVAFAAMVSNTRSVASDSKATTQVGAETSVVLRKGLADVSSLPESATPIYTWSTKLTPGGSRVTVVAIDPVGFASTVQWPETFGRSADEVVALLAADPSRQTRSDPVPAVAIDGRRLAERGAVGTVATFGYEVVGEVKSFPFATSFGAVLLMDATVLERAGQLRFEADLRREFGEDVNVADYAQFYESPLRNFRVNAVSGESAATFEAQLAEAGIGYRDLTSRQQLSQTVDEQATNWAFRYLEFVGGVSTLAVLAATVLYTSQRSDLTRLRARMAASLGIPPKVSVVAAGLEVGVLSALALLGGAATSFLVARRVMPRFDPQTDIPPSIELSVSIVQFIVIGSAILATVVIIGFGSEWRVVRRESGRA